MRSRICDFELLVDSARFKSSHAPESATLSLGMLQFRMIMDFLETKGIQYELAQHAPVYTSYEAARVRGVDASSGVKALVLKLQSNEFIIALVPGDKRADINKLAKILNAKKVSLAKPDEVLKITGCEIGSVHPFGNLAGLQTYMDRGILKNERVEFSAGLHTVSVRIASPDLVNMTKPHIADFSL